MGKSIPLPPIEVVEQFLKYDFETGILTWKVARGNRRADTPAGYVNPDGYIAINLNGRLIKAHRLAWLLHTRVDPGDLDIDHINGIKSDNRAENLRVASRRQNLWNKGKDRTNTSGYKGVSYQKYRNKWRASIRRYGRLVHLGYFDDPELAHMAYCKAAAELHGEFARGE